MPVWFGLHSEAGFRPQPRRRALPLAGLLLPVLLFCGLLLTAAGPAWGQATPKPKSKRATRVQARKARVKAILAVPSVPDTDTVTVAPARAVPAKPGQRPGSAPTPPVRNISVDPRDPVGPPPPGVRNSGQSRIPGASRKPVPDTVARPLPGGGAAATPTDTSRLVNGTRRSGDSLQVAARRKGQIETTINYSARDSIQFDVTKKVARLYEKASVVYGETDLKAALITVNYGTNTMQADGRLDSLKNKVVDRPILKDKGSTYQAGSIAYNFKSKKAKVTEAVTTQGEGYVSASTIKRLPNGDINGLLGRYTTCNLEHPHFYIQAKKMKVIPGEKVVTGPFNLVIGDVPTPLGFLFGFFPMPNKSRGSGVLIPTFGQAADRGYYLTNGGYYFAPNDYIGVRLTGDVYAGNAQQFGGWGATADISYLKRYTYQGNFNLRFTNRPVAPIVLTGDPNTNIGPTYIRPPANNSFWITWRHTPVPKPGGGVFSVNVDGGTPGYNRAYALDARRYLTTQYNSSISYSKQIRNSPINYDIKASVSQSTDGPTQISLPNFSLGVARQYPYQWFGSKPGAGGKFGASTYEQFTIGYNLIGENQISNVVTARTLGNGLPLLGGTADATRIPLSLANVGALLRNAQSGLRHNFTIGLGSYTLAQHFKLNPSVSYREAWYNKRLQYSYIPVAQAVRIDTIRGFNRVSDYSYGFDLNTVFYGTYVRKGTHKIQAIRHKVTPSLGYSYTPDAYARGNFFPQNAPAFQPGSVVLQGLNDPYGQPLTAAVANQYVFNSYNGFPNAPGLTTRQSSVAFQLQNSVEMKVRDDKDTTGTNPFRKVSLIDGLNFNIAYNFAAREGEQALSPLGVNFYTQIAKKLSVNGNASFTAYQRNSQGQLINKFLFEADPRKLLRLTAASFGANYSFNPSSGSSKSVVRRPVAPSNDPTLGTVGGTNYYADYVDFDIPWELNLTYAAGYTINSIPLTAEYIRLNNGRPPVLSLHTLGATGSIKLTPNLRLSSSLGYDLVTQSATFTSINFARDLHCWQIIGNFIPFGINRGYNFTISAKSSLLQDLKLTRNRFAQYQ